jgi:hypothetical protein
MMWHFLLVSVGLSYFVKMFNIRISDFLIVLEPGRTLFNLYKLQILRNSACVNVMLICFRSMFFSFWDLHKYSLELELQCG